MPFIKSLMFSVAAMLATQAAAQSVGCSVLPGSPVYATSATVVNRARKGRYMVRLARIIRRVLNSTRANVLVPELSVRNAAATAAAPDFQGLDGDGI